MIRALAAAALLALPVVAEAGSIRFFATGVNQQDRVRVPIDDDAAGPDASTPADIGAGSFTIEFWVKGTLADNTAGPARAPGSYADYNWITGNIVVDRDIWSADPSANRKFGISLRGGVVEFGTGAAAPDGEHTLVGATNVLTGDWRHVAVTRDGTTGVKRIFVDGAEDGASAANASTADLSYPNGGVPSQVQPCGTGPWGPYLVFGVEKHDADQHLGGCGTPPSFAYPGFRGLFDEARVWSIALTQAQVADLRNDVIPASTPGLSGYWRFEEGSGTVAADELGASPGEVIAGTAGNGEWSTDGAPVTAPSAVSGWALY
jgi:hypothetical protein